VLCVVVGVTRRRLNGPGGAKARRGGPGPGAVTSACPVACEGTVMSGLNTHSALQRNKVRDLKLDAVKRADDATYT